MTKRKCDERKRKKNPRNEKENLKRWRKQDRGLRDDDELGKLDNTNKKGKLKLFISNVVMLSTCYRNEIKNVEY